MRTVASLYPIKIITLLLLSRYNDKGYSKYTIVKSVEYEGHVQLLQSSQITKVSSMNYDSPRLYKVYINRPVPILSSSLVNENTELIVRIENVYFTISEVYDYSPNGWVKFVASESVHYEISDI